MTLVDLREDSIVVISAFLGGYTLTERLHAVGLFPGRKIRLVKAAPLGGPVLVEDVATGGRVMIGRGMAERVEVRYADDPDSR